ncbi:TetR/AcrR family transcriptional regulator [Vibrio mimicus]|uniref:TetR/AcrR family transcriptional regulator n=2 Tax=Vibrio mimicus TaxID=674 RepID=UPI0001BAE11B|nr:TetR/AcrR family transcriptional regulator [Vibrio mimicus]EEY38314.1 transcriptional regulator TetR family [Vibrio mimicus MB451]
MKLSEQKRLALIDAAIEEFTQFGFHAANMDRVCERAGTSKRTLYRHFVSKERLFVEVIDALVAQPHDSGFVYQPQHPIGEQLHHYLSMKIEVLYQQIGLNVIRMIIGEFIRDPSLTQQYLSLMGAKDPALSAWLDAAIQDQKLIDKDATQMARTLMNLFHGQFLWPQLLAAVELPDAKQQQQIIDEVVRVFVMSYAAPQCVY